ncbi:putative odorant receptor 92a [Contarinia nasturtii]|uniref:putative odorant receptor 92a n=1 Tax=Contarinia nasturtii TaxID=265458 RepID=UPI0012D372E1|nr:putative odorant receptor 92a [Contarinia nasturtii]
MKDNVAQTVNIHTKMYEIFNMVADLNSGVIFWLLPANVIFFALALYNAEHTSSADIVLIIYHIICMGTSMLWPILFCYYGTHVINRISLIGFSAYDANWFEYPSVLQKYLILIIARSQEPIHFDGLNIIYCTLEVFGKLCKTSCSYYILFRSLSHN